MFPWIACFKREFLWRMWPVLLAFPRFIVYDMFLSSVSICNTSALLIRPVDLNFPTTVHYLITIFCFPKWPKFLRHPKLCSKCIAVLSSSLNKSQVCWRKQLPLFWMVGLLEIRTISFFPPFSLHIFFGLALALQSSLVVEHVWKMMAHAQKPDLVFQRNGLVHLNWGGGGVSSVDYWQPWCAHQR